MEEKEILSKKLLTLENKILISYYDYQFRGKFK